MKGRLPVCACRFRMIFLSLPIILISYFVLFCFPLSFYFPFSSSSIHPGVLISHYFSFFFAYLLSYFILFCFSLFFLLSLFIPFFPSGCFNFPLFLLSSSPLLILSYFSSHFCFFLLPLFFSFPSGCFNFPLFFFLLCLFFSFFPIFHLPFCLSFYSLFPSPPFHPGVLIVPTLYLTRII